MSKVANPNLADRVTHASNVVNALGLAIDGLNLRHGTPNEAALDGLDWLTQHARAALEGVHALVHGEEPRWLLFQHEADVLRDLGGEA